MEDRDPFDLASLRVSTEVPTPQPPARPSRERRRFVQVPWTWAKRLKKVKRVSTYHLALVLLYEHWRGGGKPIVLSNLAVQAEGLSPRSKWNALAELEQLRLITIKKRPGRSPRITVHQAPD